jgi:hypothetical protein
MTHVRIILEETNGLERWEYTTHVETPEPRDVVDGPRGQAIAAQNRAHAIELLKDAVQSIARAIPMAQRINIQMHVPE